jgi:DNA-binding CsgD family transcriptional regulator
MPSRNGRTTAGRAQQRLLDALGRPALLAEMTGAIAHRTPALRRMLRERSAARPRLEEELARAVARFAMPSGAMPSGGRAPGRRPRLKLSREVQIGRQRYRLSAIVLEMDGVGGLDRAIVVELDPIARQRGRPAAVKRRYGLTGRQAEVAALVGRGRTSKEIARQLSIGVRTVEQHTGEVLRKLKAPNRAAVAARMSVGF